MALPVAAGGAAGGAASGVAGGGGGGRAAGVVTGATGNAAPSSDAACPPPPPLWHLAHEPSKKYSSRSCARRASRDCVTAGVGKKPQEVLGRRTQEADYNPRFIVSEVNEEWRRWDMAGQRGAARRGAAQRSCEQKPRVKPLA